MPKFLITAVREIIYVSSIEIEANAQDEAWQKADKIEAALNANTNTAETRSLHDKANIEIDNWGIADVEEI